MEHVRSSADDEASVRSRVVETPVLGLDDGYAQTKLFGGPVGSPVKLLIPSSIRPGLFGLSSMGGGGGVSAYRTEEGEEFTVSSVVAAEATTFESYHLSTMNRVLVAHALMEAGFGGCQVDVMVGLPVSDFFLDGRKNEDRIARKIANLRRGVKALSGNPVAVLRNIRVGSQAISAFVDWMLEDDLTPKRDMPERVAVVDVGGFTTDIAVILHGERVDQSRTGTTRIGMLDVYEMIASGLRTRFGMQDRLPVDLLAQALRTRVIRLWGREERLDNLVEHALVQYRSRVVREIERKLGRGADLDAILFVGGGASVLGDMRDAFPNAVLIADPEFANARGLWKYARYHEEG